MACAECDHVNAGVSWVDLQVALNSELYHRNFLVCPDEIRKDYVDACLNSGYQMDLMILTPDIMTTTAQATTSTTTAAQITSPTGTNAQGKETPHSALIASIIASVTLAVALLGFSWWCWMPKRRRQFRVDLTGTEPDINLISTAGRRENLSESTLNGAPQALPGRADEAITIPLLEVQANEANERRSQLSSQKQAEVLYATEATSSGTDDTIALQVFDMLSSRHFSTSLEPEAPPSYSSSSRNSARNCATIHPE